MSAKPPKNRKTTNPPAAKNITLDPDLAEVLHSPWLAEYLEETEEADRLELGENPPPATPEEINEALEFLQKFAGLEKTRH